MSELPQIIIPRPGSLGKEYKSPEQHWEEVVTELYGSCELPETIYHPHDLDWRNHFWSIQNAHDQAEFKAVGVWSIISVIFLLMDLTWYFRVNYIR